MSDHCRSWLSFAGKRWNCMFESDHQDAWHYWWTEGGGVSLKWRRPGISSAAKRKNQHFGDPK